MIGRVRSFENRPRRCARAIEAVVTPNLSWQNFVTICSDVSQSSASPVFEFHKREG